MNANTNADPFDLVESFTNSKQRYSSFSQLVELGSAALPAIRQGLQHENWQIRRWCAICMDHVADSTSLADLLPLFHDPKSAVRLWAVHSIACDHCKNDVDCNVDIVPHLIERIELDESPRVRKMAVIMLGKEFLDRRAVPVFQQLLREEHDRKIRLHAQDGLRRLSRAGLAD